MNQLPGGQRENGKEEIVEALNLALKISNYLNCGLDKSTLATMISLV